MNYVGSYKLSLKYHWFTPSSFKDIRISKSVFVAKKNYFVKFNENLLFINVLVSMKDFVTLHFKTYLSRQTKIKEFMSLCHNLYLNPDSANL